MSPELISILALVAMFVIATIVPINMGVLAFVGAFLVGTLVAGLTSSEILDGFPGGLFLTLVGITYLFAIAQNNGTIDWLVDLGVRAVGGRIWAIPWIMFLIAAVLTAVGAVSPGAVAIVAPIALGFAAQYQISPLMMGLLVIHGAQAGGFSPISIYGGITANVVEEAGLPYNEIIVFVASFVVNFVVALGLFVVLGGRKLMARRVEDIHLGGDLVPSASASSPEGGAGAYGEAEAEAEALGERRREVPAARSRWYQVLTLVGLAVFAALTVVWETDIGFTALSVALVLALIAPQSQKRAVGQITWPEILLITGVSTYVGVLTAMGTIDYVGENVAGLASPLIAALLLCFIGAVVSAFASSTAVLGSIIPLAVPFLQGEAGVSAVGFVAALAVSSTIVDVSPFSTNGALVLANAQGVDKAKFFRQLLLYAAAVTVIAPVVLWFAFVVIG